MDYTLEIPVYLRSEANNTDHWAKKHARKRVLKQLITVEWIAQGLHKRNIKPPVTITLVRQSPRSLDEDNLIGGCLKWVRDIVADMIIPGLAPGRADEQSLGLNFEYGQEKSKVCKLIIKIKCD